MSFELDDRIIPILQRFRLEHVARFGRFQIDRDLIGAAVERFRRETHSFHTPVGEISITLQDVSILWGLPINGQPITGHSDENWSSEVVEYFGREEEGYLAYRRAPGTYHLVTEWLREPWTNEEDPTTARLPADADEDEIRRYEKNKYLIPTIF